MSELKGVWIMIPGEHTIFKVGENFLNTEEVITRVSASAFMVRIFGAKEGEKERLLAEVYNAPWMTFYFSEEDE